MITRKQYKLLVLALTLTILFSPYIYGKIKLQYLYVKYPNRAQASMFSKNNGETVAQQIILKRIEKLNKYLNDNSYTAGEYSYDAKTDFWGLSMQWQCHECFDALIESHGNKVGDSVITGAAVNEDSYYLESLLKKGAFDVNKKLHENIGDKSTVFDWTRDNQKNRQLVINHGGKSYIELYGSKE